MGQAFLAVLIAWPSPKSVSALNAFTMGHNVVPLTHELSGDRARGVRGEGEVLDLPSMTSENEEECSGGETRTHNLAVNSRLLCH
jgi:hypothetical protein